LILISDSVELILYTTVNRWSGKDRATYHFPGFWDIKIHWAGL